MKKRRQRTAKQTGGLSDNKEKLASKTTRRMSDCRTVMQIKCDK